MAKRPINWSLNPEEWDVLSDLLREKQLSWSRVAFQQNASEAVPEKPGVYMVCARPVQPLGGSGAPDLLNMLYVGISESSIRERFKYHLTSRAKPPMKAARAVFGGALDFYFSLTPQPSDLEQPIYNCFGPAINAISPPGLRGTFGSQRAL